MDRKNSKCPAEFTLALIGGRWKVVILYHLFPSRKRFSELLRLLDGPTQKMLTQQLRELERDGLVHRKVYAEVPPRVEYSLTPVGMSLKPVVDAMVKWGEVTRGRGCESGVKKSAPRRTKRTLVSA